MPKKMLVRDPGWSCMKDCGACRGSWRQVNFVQQGTADYVEVHLHQHNLCRRRQLQISGNDWIWSLQIRIFIHLTVIFPQLVFTAGKRLLASISHHAQIIMIGSAAVRCFPSWVKGGHFCLKINLLWCFCSLLTIHGTDITDWRMRRGPDASMYISDGEGCRWEPPLACGDGWFFCCWFFRAFRGCVLLGFYSLWQEEICYFITWGIDWWEHLHYTMCTSSRSQAD